MASTPPRVCLDDLARFSQPWPTRWGPIRSTSARWDHRPDLEGTSHLSAYLKVGAVHPRTLLADLPDKDAQPTADDHCQLPHAAPCFRVLNPVRQGQRFDPQGDYVRRWVSELADLAGVAVHEPWVHPEGLAHGYPRRIVHQVRNDVRRCADMRNSVRQLVKSARRGELPV